MGIQTRLIIYLTDKMNALADRLEQKRTNKDYAIEFGEYLAQSAENLLKVVEGLEEVLEIPSDEFSALQSAIYEFRKRAAKCVQGHSR